MWPMCGNMRALLPSICRLWTDVGRSVANSYNTPLRFTYQRSTARATKFLAFPSQTNRLPPWRWQQRRYALGFGFKHELT